MPSRILKESICTSESLAYLSAEAEVLFYRLIVKADDFGLYYGSPKILASLLFPLNVPTEKKVSSWLAELVNGGLVATYRAEDGRQYDAVIFASPDLLVLPGDTIVVKRFGRDDPSSGRNLTFEVIGRPSVYATHQEIKVKDGDLA